MCHARGHGPVGVSVTDTRLPGRQEPFQKWQLRLPSPSSLRVLGRKKQGRWGMCSGGEQGSQGVPVGPLIPAGQWSPSSLHKSGADLILQEAHCNRGERGDCLVTHSMSRGAGDPGKTHCPPGPGTTSLIYSLQTSRLYPPHPFNPSSHLGPKCKGKDAGVIHTFGHNFCTFKSTHSETWTSSTGRHQ